jgi:prepilin-type N-terminal cleavage/methylation domain-containing protein
MNPRPYAPESRSDNACAARRPSSGRRSAFTLLEIMLALAIFSGVLAAIYSIWTTILRSSRIAQTAAAEVQRQRLAVRALEEALASAQMFGHNAHHYAFVADTSEEFGFLSFVARLPEAYPRGGHFGDLPVRRVEFSVEPDSTGARSLLLRQNPYLFVNDRDERENPLYLARNVVMFHLEFWGPQSKEWEEEWTLTNQLPRLVRFSLATAPEGRRTVNREDVLSRVVVLPVATAGVGAAGAVPSPGPGGGGNPPSTGGPRRRVP